MLLDPSTSLAANEIKDKTFIQITITVSKNITSTFISERYEYGYCYTTRFPFG